MAPLQTKDGKDLKASHPDLTILQSNALTTLFTKIRGVCRGEDLSVILKIYRFNFGLRCLFLLLLSLSLSFIITEFATVSATKTQQDKESKAIDFVHYSKRIMRLLAEEALSHLPTTPQTITTPTNVPYEGHLSMAETNPDHVCAVSIVRAGDSLLESFRECVPSLRVGKIWIQRNEDSSEKEAVWSCTKLPEGIDGMEVILCDPMLATGGSSCTALRILVNDFGVMPEKIIFANVICCPEGLEALANEFPKVKIVTCWIDEKLNDDKFILPGLGDYGDRFFNTV